MPRRSVEGLYPTEEGGAIKYARTKSGEMLGFLTKPRGSYRRRKSAAKESPSPEVRRIIAQNIDKIEKKLGTKFLRTNSGLINSPLGYGYFGVVFRLDNGNVLKVSLDTTEGGSAIFWKEHQEKNPKLLAGTAKVYKVFSIRRKDKKYFYFIEREAVDADSYIPYPVRQYLNKFIDEFHQFCSSDSKKYSYIYLERAKIAIEGLRRHSKGLADVLSFAWDKGLPQIDATEINVGVRFEKGIGKGAKIGQWVLFDFGGLSERCFDLVVKNSSGKKTNIKGILKTYCKKVPVLK